MAAQRTFTASQGWVEVTSLLVVEIMTNGMTINRSKFIEFIPSGFFLSARILSSGWLAYRIHEDSIDGDIISTGYLADWRVVQVLAAT